MSADNWTNCPRCLDAAEKAHAAEIAAVMATYGTIPVEEFDAKRAALPTVTPAASEVYMTFREDYEIYDAETGEVRISYRGGCTKCSLACEIKTSKLFFQPTPGAGPRATTEQETPSQ